MTGLVTNKHEFTAAMLDYIIASALARERLVAGAGARRDDAYSSLAQFTAREDQSAFL